jgi:hypothetical protein
MLPKIAFSALLACACSAQCPLQFLKVDPLVKQGWGRSGRALASHNEGRNMPPDFEVKVKNSAEQPIRGLKVQASYFDATEDLHRIPMAWNFNSRIEAGAEKTMSWPNELYTDKTLVGWIVVPVKILYEDGSTWQASPENLTDCYGEYWRDKKHPRLTKLPVEAIGSPDH